MEIDKSVLEIRNIKYWKSFYNFFKRLFYFFNKIPKELIPKKDEFSIKIGDKGTLIYKQIPTINFELLIKNNIKTIIKWPEYLELSYNVIFLDADGKTFEDENNFHLNNNYLIAITEILYKKFNYSFKFKRKLALVQYKLIENYIYSNYLLFTVKVPIFNLEIEQKVIKIEDKIYLKKIEEADLKLFNPSFPYFNFGINPFLLSCKTIIELEENVKKGQAHTVVEVDTLDTIYNVISSLCIYKRSKVAIGPIFLKPKDFWSIFAGVHSSFMPNETYIHYKKILLEKKDIRPFRIFWKKYNDSLKKDLWLGLAGRRLLRMFYKMRIEEQFVDIMIIFEMLFLPKGNVELKYRLSILVASLLGKNFKEKKDIYKLFKVSYDIRSSIIHDGFISSQNEKQLKKLGINIDGLYERLQYYLFRSIEIFTKNPDIRDNFEDIIFR